MTNECHKDPCSKKAGHVVYYTNPDDTHRFCEHHAINEYRTDPKAFKVSKAGHDGLEDADADDEAESKTEPAYTRTGNVPLGETKIPSGYRCRIQGTDMTVKNDTDEEKMLAELIREKREDGEFVEVDPEDW